MHAIDKTLSNLMELCQIKFEFPKKVCRCEQKFDGFNVSKNVDPTVKIFCDANFCCEMQPNLVREQLDS